MKEFKKGELVRLIKWQRVSVESKILDYSYWDYQKIDAGEIGEITSVQNCRGTCKKRDIKKCVSQSISVKGMGMATICSGYFRHLTEQEEFLYHIYGDSYGDDNADTI